MKIAVFAHTLDPLFLRKIPKNISLYLLVSSRAGQSSWLMRQVSKKRIIRFTPLSEVMLQEVTDDDLIKNSNITSQLKKYGIQSFVTSHRGSSFLSLWAKKNKFNLLSPDTTHQIRFENKIWFDSFLGRRGFPKPNSSVKKGSQIRFSKPLVIQEPSSFGSFGTFIVRTARQLSNLKSSGYIKKTQKYLVREFVKGKTYGTTLFIDRNHIILSACRLQCFYENKNAKPIFAGIQWVPTRSLGRKAIEAINDIFVQLGFIMHGAGYEGYAHFDFIVTPEKKISILECNPRLSSATPHLFYCPELTGGYNTGSLFINKYLQHENDQVIVSGLPDSKYSGSLLDLVCLDSVGTIGSHRAFGSYDAVNGTFHFKSSRIPNLTSDRNVMLFTGIEESGKSISIEDTMGSLITNFPLFSLEGKLSRYGKRALSFFNMLKC